MAIKINGVTVIDDSRVGTLVSATTTGNVVAGNVTTAGLISAAGSVTGGGITLSGNTISSTGGTLTIDPATTGQNGNVIIAGNLSVQGNVTYIDSTEITTNEKDIVLANNVNTQSAVNGAGLLLGNNSVVTWTYNNTSNAWVSNVGVSAVGNITGGNVLGGANVNATTHTGTTVSVTGNIDGGNLRTAGLISATGNITGGNLSGTNITGTLATAAQTNITSVGTLTSLNSGAISSSGNVTGANILTAGLVSATGNVTGANLNISGDIYDTGAFSIISGSNGNITLNAGTGNVNVGRISASGNITASTYFGTIGTASQTNITGLGTITTGVWQGSSISTTYTDAKVTSVNGSTGAVTGLATTGGTLAQFASTTSAQLAGVISDETGSGSLVFASSPSLTTPNIGAATGTSLNVGTGAVTLGSIVNANANGVGNIGSATTYFNTVHAKATSAQYADLAEMYEADGVIEPGTVVAFGGTREVTTCGDDSSRRVAGVVSTNPSYIMNAGLSADHVVAVALTGRVPTRVTGSIRKGDLMVSAGGGRARADANPAVGAVIGKALADFDGADGVIEVVVGRL